jgi:hypothetical protein
MSRYSWRDGMAQISGYGGKYEQVCELLVLWGVYWLENNEPWRLRFVCSFKSPRNSKDANRLLEFITSMVDVYTPQQMVWAVNAICWIAEFSWDEYIDFMIKKKQHQNERGKC